MCSQIDDQSQVGPLCMTDFNTLNMYIGLDINVVCPPPK